MAIDLIPIQEEISGWVGKNPHDVCAENGFDFNNLGDACEPVAERQMSLLRHGALTGADPTEIILASLQTMYAMGFFAALEAVKVQQKEQEEA